MGCCQLERLSHSTAPPSRSVMSTPAIPAEKARLTREEINRKQKEYIFPSVTTYYSDPVPMDHALMQHVWDVEGQKYLDFFGGIVTISVGHCNPRVISRTKAQIDRLQHVSTCFPNEPMVALAEKLAQITPGTLKKSYFTNSGTEANETAIQVARMHTGNLEVVALRHGYSGRSSLARGLTGMNTWRRGTIEVGIEHWEVEPDVITAAKGMGNGVPIGLTIAKPEIADSFQGLTISTFGGNPVTCVTAKAVIDVIEEDDLRTNAAVVGGYFRQKLEDLQEKHPLIGDVRGMGLMQALELVEDRTTKQPSPAGTNAVMEEARKRGLLVGKGGFYGNVIRMSPPLNISRADVDEAVRILDESFRAVEQRKQ